MPVPENTNELTLGRSLFDKRKFRFDTDPAVIDCLERMAKAAMGSGWPSPAKKGDTVYLDVYAQPDGGGAHNLYGGNPADPVNPTPLVVSASGSATVNWQDEGPPTVVSSGTANFVGAGVTLTDVSGVATITIPGGGGASEAFKTIAITVASGAAGQADVVADLAADTLTLAEDFGIEIRTNAGTDTITFDFRNGNGLESDGGAPALVRVKAHTYIDVTSDGVAVDLTEVSGYVSGDFQFLVNNTGTFEFITPSDETPGPITPESVGNKFGILIADMPATTVTYHATNSSITPGAVDNSIIPLHRDDTGTDSFFGSDQSSGTQKILYGVNPIWPTVIKAGTTTNENKPVVVVGYVTLTWLVDSVETEAFIIQNVIYPITIISFLTNGAVATTDGTFPVDNIAVLWGRDPGVSSISDVINPDAWDAANNAYGLAMQLTDGTWQAIDLACPA